MSHYILRFRGKGSIPEGDLERISGANGIKVLDKTARMLHVEGSYEAVTSVTKTLVDWLVSEEIVVKLPDARKRPNRSVSDEP